MPAVISRTSSLFSYKGSLVIVVSMARTVCGGSLCGGSANLFLTSLCSVKCFFLRLSLFILRVKGRGCHTLLKPYETNCGLWIWAIQIQFDWLIDLDFLSLSDRHDCGCPPERAHPSRASHIHQSRPSGQTGEQEPLPVSCLQNPSEGTDVRVDLQPKDQRATLQVDLSWRGLASADLAEITFQVFSFWYCFFYFLLLGLMG